MRILEHLFWKNVVMSDKDFELDEETLKKIEEDARQEIVDGDSLDVDLGDITLDDDELDLDIDDFDFDLDFDVGVDV